jgi:hypothetical protein|tara:strand:- start:312 stop:446 length:135 start_codon:yes stop_codon:yes gene_type:complete
LLIALSTILYSNFAIADADIGKKYSISVKVVTLLKKNRIDLVLI